MLMILYTQCIHINFLTLNVWTVKLFRFTLWFKLVEGWFRSSFGYVLFLCVRATQLGPSIWLQIDIISYEGLVHEGVVFIFDCLSGGYVRN